jgi:hypothetical protein
MLDGHLLSNICPTIFHWTKCWTERENKGRYEPFFTFVPVQCPPSNIPIGRWTLDTSPSCGPFAGRFQPHHSDQTRTLRQSELAQHNESNQMGERNAMNEPIKIVIREPADNAAARYRKARAFLERLSRPDLFEDPAREESELAAAYYSLEYRAQLLRRETPK